MSLFTFILEFDGGTYISQFRAASLHDAVAQYPSHVIGNKALSTPPLRRRLAEALPTEDLIAIDGMRNVWCSSTSIGKKFALLNIVATA